MYSAPSAFGTDSSGTRRMIVAVDSAQKPPMVMPRSARAAMKTVKLVALAIRSSDASIVPVSAMSIWRRSKRPATLAISRLVATAKKPETEMACPAIPWLAPRSAAIGVSRLTGMNSDAISIATHMAMAPTALDVWRLDRLRGKVNVVMNFHKLCRSAGTGCAMAGPKNGSR